MKENLHLKDRLLLLMNKHGVNNAELARAIGVSHVAIGNFLKGQIPRSEHLFAIAKYFGVSMEYLLGGDPETPGEILEEKQAGYGDPRARILTQDQSDAVIELFRQDLIRRIADASPEELESMRRLFGFEPPKKRRK